MPPPSALSIKTSAVVRLIREESSYHKEQDQQASRLEKLIADNADEYEIKQQRTVVEQTKDVVPAVREKLIAAVEALEFALENEDKETEEAKEKARKAIEDGKKVTESS